MYSKKMYMFILDYWTWSTRSIYYESVGERSWVQFSLGDVPCNHWHNTRFHKISWSLLSMDFFFCYLRPPSSLFFWISIKIHVWCILYVFWLFSLSGLRTYKLHDIFRPSLPTKGERTRTGSFQWRKRAVRDLWALRVKANENLCCEGESIRTRSSNVD